MSRWEYLTVELEAGADHHLTLRMVNGAELKDWKRLGMPTYLAQ